jgi:hypothetical protein
VFKGVRAELCHCYGIAKRSVRLRLLYRGCFFGTDMIGSNCLPVFWFHFQVGCSLGRLPCAAAGLVSVRFPRNLISLAIYSFISCFVPYSL